MFSIFSKKGMNKIVIIFVVFLVKYINVVFISKLTNNIDKFTLIKFDKLFLYSCLLFITLKIPEKIILELEKVSMRA